tara:strand:+ start:291 stop:1445 length:1155 start_codon:yes stop_codon:yes gene_type:complete
MAIIRLTDIVTVMKSKWTYGDKFFGYTEEFNDNHNTQYPSLLITPPSSVFPEVSLNNGWEEYTFEIYFSDLYNRTAQANVNLDQRWDNLQDLANEWLDMFLKNYQDGVVTGFLEGEEVNIERVKEVANDQLIQIKMIFTWRVFSKCFRPVSVYPSDIANLVTWFRADSGLTFSIPTKRISAWEDQSVTKDNLVQTTKSNRPLRYTYDGANDKTRIEFNGTTDSLISKLNCPITTEFTIFFVAKVDLDATEKGKYFSYINGLTELYIGSVNNRLEGFFADYNGTGDEITLGVSYNTSSYHIAVAKLKDKTFTLQYNDHSDSITAGDYDTTNTFNATTYTMGYKAGSSAANYLNGDMQEFIVYNSGLDDFNISKIKNYLNKKYNIY